MNSLQNALKSAGLVSVKQERVADAEMQLRLEQEAAEHAKPMKEMERRRSILREAKAPDLFRREARKILLSDPEQIHELINLAHSQGMKEQKAKGGTWLIANLYQVRQAIQRSGLSQEDKITLVDRLFSKK